jgi:putative ABC transport system permease protein
VNLPDLRYLLRSLLRSPGYTSAAIATLALGIGANVALFLLVDAVFFRPLPYSHDESLAMLWSFPARNEADARPWPASYADFLDWQQRNSAFEGMAAYNISVAALSDGGEAPEDVAGATVTPNFFTVLEVKPIVGVGFANAQIGDHVVLLGYGLWHRRYHGDNSLIGRTILLSGVPYTVVGIVPREFEQPEPFWNRQAEYWTPLPTNTALLPRDRRSLRVIGRTKTNTSMKQAQAEMSRVGKQLQKEQPQFDGGLTIQVISLRKQLLGDLRRPLLLLLGGAGILLLIACVNATNLQLARAIAREREILTRNALGAPVHRIILLILGESSLLAVFAAAAGCLLAVVIDNLVTSLGTQFAVFSHATMTPRAALFAFGTVAITGLLTSVVPVSRVMTLQLRGLMNFNSHDRQSGPVWHRLRGALVAIQLALVLPLLIVASLLGRGFYRLVSVDPGFNADHLLTFRLSLPPAHYPEPAQTQRFFSELREQLQSIPGVHSVALSSGLPLTALNTRQSRTFVGERSSTRLQTGSAYYRIADEHYFATMGIPLVAGRGFIASDGLNGPYVTVVNESFAKTYWKGTNPIGRSIQIGDLAANGGWVTIVGVVGDVHYDDLAEAPTPEFYIPFTEDPWRLMAMVLRTDASAAALVPLVRATVQRQDPLLPLSEIQTMSDVIRNSTRRSRFALLIVSISSTLALLLGLAGVSALVSYIVADRTREFGIRIALGAQPTDILNLVLGYAAKLVVVGLAIGIVITVLLVPIFSHFVYGMRATDVTSVVVASLLLLFSVLVACYFPGRRATHIQPALSLRRE